MVLLSKFRGVPVYSFLLCAGLSFYREVQYANKCEEIKGRVGGLFLYLEMFLAGFLFLLILVLQIAMGVSGYILESSPKHYDSDAVLPKFADSPGRFKAGVALALIEHFCVIALAVLLFLVYNPFNLILGIVLLVFRVIEGLIQVYIEGGYWGLLGLARRYSAAKGKEKTSLSDSHRTILETKNRRFAIAMVCWSIGTFAFTILLFTEAVVYPIIVWVGIAACVVVGINSAIKAVRGKGVQALLVGALLAIAFEVVIGIWLIYYSIFFL